MVELDGQLATGVGDVQRLMTSERIARPVTVAFVRNGVLSQADVVPVNWAECEFAPR